MVVGMELGVVKDMASAGMVCIGWTTLEQEHKGKSHTGQTKETKEGDGQWRCKRVTA